MTVGQLKQLLNDCCDDEDMVYVSSNAQLGVFEIDNTFNLGSLNGENYVMFMLGEIVND